jgi:Bacterial Ig-like domain/Bacterial Ig domain
MSDKEPPQLQGEKISFNSRAVLLGLFILVGFILLVFTISVNIFPAEQSGRLNTVFVAAISGALALGGTLISQLWGKSDTSDRPIVYITNPEDVSTGIPVDTSISASFNMLMDKSNIAKTFTLKETATNSNVEGEIKLEGGNAIFKPSNPLKYETKYTAKISKDAKSVTGKSLESDKEWSFTTAKEAKSTSSDMQPKADNQRVITKMNSPVEIVLKAESQDKDKLRFIKVSDPLNGKLSGFDPATGKVTYNPNKDYLGSDSFTFKANDTKADSNVATISITINKL